MLRTALFAGVTAVVSTLVAAPLLADIEVVEPYARVSTAMSKSGAAFMVIENTGTEDDRLIAVRADVSDRVELHTHKENDQGVMQMMEVEAGFVIPAGGHHALARGGDHVMFLGLTESLADGDSVPVTLVFENAGEVEVDIPVDLNRKPNQEGGMSHGGAMQHEHGDKTN